MSNPRPMTLCPICRCQLRADRVDRHRFRVHGTLPPLSVAKPTTRIERATVKQTPIPTKPHYNKSGTATAYQNLRLPAKKTAGKTVKPFKADERAVGHYATRTGTKFHEYGCKCLAGSRIRITEEMLSKKYTPCEVCLPNFGANVQDFSDANYFRGKGDWRRVPGSFGTRQ